MKINAVFVKDGDWWVGWTENVPGAMTQGKTIQEARENLIDAVQEMQKPVDLNQLPHREIVTETIEV
ncbi:MAG TPA: type II toxin-antitoxin system HicB family antitoxin [Desulfatiglandales bacterium]|nr:type II toxin-antitoxin system HicB family antitoxin [Desulfatiglandales bacterium]